MFLSLEANLGASLEVSSAVSICEFGVKTCSGKTFPLKVLL